MNLQILLQIMALLVLVTNCGLNDELLREKVKKERGENDPFFDTYKEQFAIETNVSAEHIYIRFNPNLNKNKDPKKIGRIAAVCVATFGYEEYNYVMVDPKSWEGLTPARKEALIFHELIHCVFHFYNHINEMMTDIRCPKSLMHPYVLGDFCYTRFRDRYMDDMNSFKK
jgi:hypothetical protein